MPDSRTDWLMDLATGEWGWGRGLLAPPSSLDEVGGEVVRTGGGGEPAILDVEADMERGAGGVWPKALLDETDRLIFLLAANRILDTMSLADTDC